MNSDIVQPVLLSGPAEVDGNRGGDGEVHGGELQHVRHRVRRPLRRSLCRSGKGYPRHQVGSFPK